MPKITDEEAQQVLDLMGPDDDYTEGVSGERRRAKLEADARALWAVRVLDNEARQRGIDEGPYRPHWVGDEWEIVIAEKLVRFADPDAARIAAATAFVAADPGLDPSLRD